MRLVMYGGPRRLALAAAETARGGESHRLHVQQQAVKTGVPRPSTVRDERAEDILTIFWVARACVLTG